MGGGGGRVGGGRVGGGGVRVDMNEELKFRKFTKKNRGGGSGVFGLGVFGFGGQGGCE